MRNVHRESATIHQFPVGGRDGLRNRAGAFKSPAHVPDALVPDALADVAYGSSWYHDEAVREADEQPRKN